MRVRRARRDERGAVLILVGVFAMVMFAMTAFVVDIGNQRQNRVQLATATDAAALDVAQEWADAKLDGLAAGFAATELDTWDCRTVAETVVRENNDGLDPDSVSCIAELEGDDWGVVTVAASETVDYQFGAAIGTDSGDTKATTSVKVSGASQGGLRPFALCSKLPAIENLKHNLPGPHKIDAVKHLTPECGTASGNWGLLDLDGKGAKFVGDLFANGYDKPVEKSAAPNVCEEAEDDELVSCFRASPGAKWNAGPVKSALDFLDGSPSCDDGGPEFFVPTYDTVLDPHGANAKFPLTGFARVQLMCFTVGGSNLNSLTLNLIEYLPDECCSGVSETNQILEICDVGTIGGALGPDYESSCGTPSATPPALEAGCAVQPIAPAARDVLVTGAGRSTGSLQVDVNVDDIARCGDLRLRAVVQGTERLVPAPAPSKVGNTYRYIFPQNTDFGTGGTFLTLVVYEDDYVWDQSATLHTVLDNGSPTPTAVCRITSTSVNPATVMAKKGSDQTEADVVFSARFELPSSCGTVRAVLRRVDAPEDTINIGSAPVTAVMDFTMPDKTHATPGTWRVHYYREPGATLIGTGAAVLVKSG